MGQRLSVCTEGGAVQQGRVQLAVIILQKQKANLNTCPAPEFHHSQYLFVLHFAESIQVAPVLAHFQDLSKVHQDSAGSM